MGKDRYLVSEIQKIVSIIFVCVKGSMKCALIHNCAYHKESATTESKRVTTCLLLENTNIHVYETSELKLIS